MDINAIISTIGNPKVSETKEKDGLVLIGISLETAYASVITDGKMAEIALEYGDCISPIGGGFQTLEYEMAVSEPMRIEEVGALLERLAGVNLNYPNPLPLWIPRGGQGLMASVFGISEVFGYDDEERLDDDDALPF